MYISSLLLFSSRSEAHANHGDNNPPTSPQLQISPPSPQLTHPHPVECDPVEISDTISSSYFAVLAANLYDSAIAHEFKEIL